MLKQTFLNAVFTGGAQAVSLLVIIALAAILDAADFGTLSIQLSLAAVLSILCTLQFERVYVRVRLAALGRYIAFHVFSLTVVSSCFLLIAVLLGAGKVAVVLAAATGLSQIALYSAARQGRFVRIWVMKAVQAASLLGLSVFIYVSQRDDMYWLAFVGSYFCAGLLAFDQATRRAMFNRTLRHDIRRAAYSAHIAALALGSLLAGSFTREFPVILSGALGRPETAGALGLVLRTVGAPIGLLARSAAAVVSNYVASGRFDTAAMIKLSVVPIIGIIYILLLLGVSFFVPAMTKYGEFAVFLVALAPYFILRAYTGLLGAAFVFYRMQWFDFICNVLIAISVGLTGLAVSFVDVPFITLLWVVSAANAVFAITIVRRLFLHLGHNPTFPDPS